MNKEELNLEYRKLKENIGSFGIKGAVVLGGASALVMHGVINTCEDIVVYMLEDSFNAYMQLPGGVVEHNIKAKVWVRCRNNEGIELINKGDANWSIYALPLTDLILTANADHKTLIEAHLYRAVKPFINDLLTEGVFYGSGIELPNVRKHDGFGYETILKRHFRDSTNA